MIWLHWVAQAATTWLVLGVLGLAFSRLKPVRRRIAQLMRLLDHSDRARRR